MDPDGGVWVGLRALGADVVLGVTRDERDAELVQLHLLITTR